MALPYALDAEFHQYVLTDVVRRFGETMSTLAPCGALVAPA